MEPCTDNVASENYADFIYRHSNLTIEELTQRLQTTCIDYISREFVAVYAPLPPLLPITIEKYTYTAIPKLYTLLDTSSMEASGILSTFNQPTLNVMGEGTIIGFVDTGIDYQNPLFRNADGTTRIVGIWDQTIPNPRITDEPAPGVGNIDPNDRILYGTEYTQEQINAALSSPDPFTVVPSTDTYGHGTFVSGIAAGGATPNEDFTGAAPRCQIAMVKLKPAKQYLRDFYLVSSEASAFQENDIMMGIKYLISMAKRYQMPLTIYLGIGTNSGSHDGTSPLSLQIRDLSRLLGVIVVVAAGNEAGLRHHYLGEVDQNQEYEDVEIRVAPKELGFTLELWAVEPELYTVGFISPTGEMIQRIPITTTDDTRIPFLLESTVITVSYRNSEIGSGSQLIFMRFEAPTEGIWKIRVFNSIFITGEYHMWLPIQGFVSDDTFFLRPNPYTTITDPGNSSLPITVSNYNHINNSIYIHSSRGYSRSGALKPDLAAPGVNVYGPGIPSPSSGRLLADDNRFPMTRNTGSSISAAHVAGAVADLLTWGIVRGNDMGMSDVTVKAYLIRGAQRSPSYTYPNREWGYGALDLYGTFLRLRE